MRLTGKPYERAYVGGTFDLFHDGHRALLEGAKKLAKEVVVSLNTDAFAARYKREPIDSFFTRLQKVADSGLVDNIIANVGCEDSKPAILIVQPDVIIHGDDWTGKPFLKQLGLTHDWLNERGIDVLYLPYTKGISTTQLIERGSLGNTR